MCQTNIYVDRYPDGKEISFQQTQYCQYGAPGRLCQNHSTLSNPVRKIQFSEPTTEYMMTHTHHPYQQHQHHPVLPQQPRTQFPSTPPRSRGRDESPPMPILRRHSKRQSVNILPIREVLPTLKPHREHRKERIVIVDSPPTPRTPPMHFSRPQVFTAPSSPATPPYNADHHRYERGRPIIVDERTSAPPRREPQRERDSSLAANVGERLPIPIPSSPRNRNPPRRNRSLDRGVFQWDSPSTSHTSFDSRARREAEEAERRRRELDEAERRERREAELAKMEASKRMDAKIRAQDEEIRRRPAVPLPKSAMKKGRETVYVSGNTATVRDGTPLRESPAVRDIPRVTINGQSPGSIGLGLKMTAGELKLAEEAEIRRRMAERDREAKASREREERDRELRELERREREREREREWRRGDMTVGAGGVGEEDAEAVLKRLRERQMPRRRFSVGPGGRRHRVLYDDGVYRWE